MTSTRSVAPSARTAASSKIPLADPTVARALLSRRTVPRPDIKSMTGAPYVQLDATHFLRIKQADSRDYPGVKVPDDLILETRTPGKPSTFASLGQPYGATSDRSSFTNGMPRANLLWGANRNTPTPYTVALSGNSLYLVDKTHNPNNNVGSVYLVSTAR